MSAARRKYTLEFEQESDGRWICEVLEVPGAMAYGETPRQAAIAVFEKDYFERWKFGGGRNERNQE